MGIGDGGDDEVDLDGAGGSEEAGALGGGGAGGQDIIDEVDGLAGEGAVGVMTQMSAQGEGAADVVDALGARELGLLVGVTDALDGAEEGPVVLGGEGIGDEEGLVESAGDAASPVEGDGDDDVGGCGRIGRCFGWGVRWECGVVDDAGHGFTEPRGPCPGVAELHGDDPVAEGMLVGSEPVDAIPREGAIAAMGAAGVGGFA